MKNLLILKEDKIKRFLNLIILGKKFHLSPTIYINCKSLRMTACWLFAGEDRNSLAVDQVDS